MSGALPQGWELVALGTFIEGFDAGANFKCDERPPTAGDVGVVKVSAVTWGEYNENASKTCRDDSRIDPKLFVRAGDLLFSRANTIDLVGAAVIARHVTKNIMLSDKILRLRLRGIEPEWVLYALRAPEGRRQIEELATGNQESMRNIGQDRIRSIMLPVAGPRMRSRIVAAIEQHLTDIDAGVAALERVQANIKRYRASVLKAACEGRLVLTEAELARRDKREFEPAHKLLARLLERRRARWEQVQLAKMAERGQTPRDERWKSKYDEPRGPEGSGLPSLPEGWCWATPAQIFASVTDGDHQPPPQTDSGIPFLVIGNIRHGDISFDGARCVSAEYYEGLDPARRPARGDLLYTVTGSFGIPVVVRTDAPFCVQRHVAILRPLPSTNVALVAAFLASSFGFKQAVSVATGTAQKTVPLTGLRAFAIPFPPAGEQRRIVAEVDRLLSIADETERVVQAQLARAARLRQSVLKAAFEGKLVAQDPNDEPASAMLARSAAIAAPKMTRRHVASASDTDAT